MVNFAFCMLQLCDKAELTRVEWYKRLNCEVCEEEVKQVKHGVFPAGWLGASAEADRRLRARGEQGSGWAEGAEEDSRGKGQSHYWLVFGIFSFTFTLCMRMFTLPSNYFLFWFPLHTMPFPIGACFAAQRGCSGPCENGRYVEEEVLLRPSFCHIWRYVCHNKKEN